MLPKTIKKISLHDTFKTVFQKDCLLSRWYRLPFEASSQKEAVLLFTMKIKIQMQGFFFTLLFRVVPCLD